LSPGSSTHLHTNNTENSTNNNPTTQITNNVEDYGPCPVFASFILAFALQVRKYIRSCFLIAVGNILYLDSSAERTHCYISMATLDGFYMVEEVLRFIGKTGRAEDTKVLTLYVHCLSCCDNISHNATHPFLSLQ